LCSSNPLAYNHNICISIFPYIIIKDILCYYVVCICFQFILCLGIYSLCHPDNSIEVYELLTPQHIVPEWYFMYFYVMLKSVPSKWLGFIMFIICIYVLVILSEVSNHKSNILRLTLVSFMYFNNSNVVMSYSFVIFIIEVIIGWCISWDVVISCGRVLNFINNYNVYLHIYSWTLY
jgi:quinol-cytochrome oxidoreductase complex cytochrome b subunit